MEPFEIMISESQERMLAIVEPAKLDELLAICAKWEIAASVIGTVTGTGRFRILDRLDGEVLADIPADSLDDDAPLYDRPLAEPADRAARAGRRRRGRRSAARRRRAPTCSALLADTSWVWSPVRPPAVPQHRRGPGRRRHRAAPQGPPHRRADTGRGLGLTTDGNHRWCAARPAGRHGGRRGRVGDEPGLRRRRAARRSSTA